MLGLFNALPLLWRVVTILGLLAALAGAVGGVYAFVRHQGYVDGYADARAKCDEEKRRQEDANRRAIEEAYRRLEELTQQLDIKEAQLDDIIDGIDLASVNEPGSAEQCLSADSVRRLSAIQ